MSPHCSTIEKIFIIKDVRYKTLIFLGIFFINVNTQERKHRLEKSNTNFERQCRPSKVSSNLADGLWVLENMRTQRVMQIEGSLEKRTEKIDIRL
jgi:hypothetical protein